MSGEMRIDREALEAVLVAHQRRDIGSCLCGWGDLGRSHAVHVADAVLALLPTPTSPGALRALSEAATPGEWYAVGAVVSFHADEDNWTKPRPRLAHALSEVSEDQCEADAEFIAAAVNHVRALLAEAADHTPGVSADVRTMQATQPWTAPYSDLFEASKVNEPHRALAHDLMHVVKAAGILASICEAADHGRVHTSRVDQAEMEGRVSDLVMCALHMANNPPPGYDRFDLQAAVIARVERVNDVTWAEVTA